LPVLFVGLAAGLVLGFWIHATMSARSSALPLVAEPPIAGRVAEPAGRFVEPEHSVISADPIAELRRRRLRLPVDDARIEQMKGSFAERRGGGARGHEAVDLLAPRETPVHAVEDGTIARLFFSKAGGNTIYQFDPSGQFCYYYAHLERYASGLRENEEVSAGEVIGYVGTSGNAPPDTPHLHFAVFKLTDAGRWWEGAPLDPYLVFGP
jgi:murein DD-endopeptidase MepM/ murein hydrolase activator NlpD